MKLVATSLDKLPSVAELTVMQNMLTALMPWSVSYMGVGLPSNLDTLNLKVTHEIWVFDEEREISNERKEEDLTYSLAPSPSLVSGFYCQSRHK